MQLFYIYELFFSVKGFLTVLVIDRCNIMESIFLTHSNVHLLNLGSTTAVRRQCFSYWTNIVGLVDRSGL